MELFIKSFALFFLVQGILTTVSLCLWLMLRQFMPRRRLPHFALISLVLPLLASLIFVTVLSLGVQFGIFRMVNPFFSVFMYAPFENMILVAGLIGIVFAVLSAVRLAPSSSARKIKDAEKLGYLDGIPVYESAQVSLAMLDGVRDNRILVSPLILSKSELALPALLHEYIHARLGHNLIKYLYRIVARFNIFNPLVWKVCDELDLYCELECDEYVATLLGRVEYRDYLLSLPALLRHGSTGISTRMKERILALVSEKKGSIFAFVLPSLTTSALMVYTLVDVSMRCPFVCVLGY